MIARSWVPTLAMSLALGARACSPHGGRSTRSAPTSVSPWAAAAHDPAPPGALSVAPSASAASAEPELPLDEDTNDDGPTVHDRGIGELIAKSTHVVVGKIVEAKEVKKATPGGTTVQRYVVIAIEGFLAGDPASVHGPYRKGFALFDVPMLVGTSKSYAEGQVDFLSILAASVGERGVFFVRLPGAGGESWSEPGPPEPILRRWGKYTVSLVGLRPDGARAEVVATIREAREERAWVATNAARLWAADRFVAGSVEGVAELVARFVEEDLSTRGGLRVTATEQERERDDGTVRFRYRLEGAPEATGTLEVAVDVASFGVVSYRIDAPFVRRTDGAGRGDAAKRGRELRRRLGLRTRGAKAFTRAAEATYGDGRSVFSVRVDGGKALLPAGAAARRSARIVASGAAGVIIEYANDWARDGGRGRIP